MSSIKLQELVHQKEILHVIDRYLGVLILLLYLIIPLLPILVRGVTRPPIARHEKREISVQAS